MKLQMGMFGPVKKFQAVFENLAGLYDTDDERYLHSIMVEALTALLRNGEYCGYASSAGKVFQNFDEGERKFKSVSFEERGKFREETLTNFDGQRRTKVASQLSGDELDSWLIVTFVIAIEGSFKLGKINSLADLRKTITTLAGTRVDELVAFELLWTPQAAGEGYTKNEMLEDYPALVTLS